MTLERTFHATHRTECMKCSFTHTNTQMQRLQYDNAPSPYSLLATKVWRDGCWSDAWRDWTTRSRRPTIRRLCEHRYRAHNGSPRSTNARAPNAAATADGSAAWNAGAVLRRHPAARPCDRHRRLYRQLAQRSNVSSRSCSAGRRGRALTVTCGSGRRATSRGTDNGICCRRHTGRRGRDERRGAWRRQRREPGCAVRLWRRRR
jgi:hypothetical protein